MNDLSAAPTPIDSDALATIHGGEDAGNRTAPYGINSPGGCIPPTGPQRPGPLLPIGGTGSPGPTFPFGSPTLGTTWNLPKAP